MLVRVVPWQCPGGALVWQVRLPLSRLWLWTGQGNPGRAAAKAQQQTWRRMWSRARHTRNLELARWDRPLPHQNGWASLILSSSHMLRTRPRRKVRQQLRLLLRCRRLHCLRRRLLLLRLRLLLLLLLPLRRRKRRPRSPTSMMRIRKDLGQRMSPPTWPDFQGGRVCLRATRHWR